MPTKKPTDAPTEIEILKLNTGRAHLAILGTTPFLCNAMNTHNLQNLLVPPQKKNAAAKATTLKHDPYREFRASAYTSRDPRGPTVIQMLSSAFKGAMAGAAKDLPGASKAEIARWSWVVGERVNIFGTPKLSMMMVRSADMARTPDVRTRAILPRWACYLDIAFLQPMLGPVSVANLLLAGGQLQGVGDGRQEKGKLNYGCFTIVDPNDPSFLSVLQEGRPQQAAAFDRPKPYDEQTEGLLNYFDDKASQRNMATDKGIRADA